MTRRLRVVVVGAVVAVLVGGAPAWVGSAADAAADEPVARIDVASLRGFGLVTPAATAAFLEAYGPTPVTTDATFEAPAVAGCERLRDALGSAASDATVAGAQWTTNDGVDELNETVWQFGSATEATRFQRRVEAADVESCSRAAAAETARANGVSSEFGEFGALPALRPILKKSKTTVFADTATQLTTTDATGEATADFVTIWLRQGQTVARLAVRLASADAVDAEGTLQPALAAPVQTLATDAAAGLFKANESAFVRSGGTDILDAITPSTPVFAYQQGAPSTNPACADVNEVRASAAEVQKVSIRHAGTGATLTLTSTRFETGPAVQEHLAALKAAGIARCFKGTLETSAPAGATVSAAVDEVKYGSLPEAARGEIDAKDYNRDVLAYDSTVTIEGAGGATGSGTVIYVAKTGGSTLRELQVQVQSPPAATPPIPGPLDASDLVMFFMVGALDKQIAEALKKTDNTRPANS
jgi:hypothetical protein